MASYKLMGLCMPAFLVLIPNMLAAAAVAIGAGIIGDAVAGIVGGLLAALVALVVGGGVASIPAAIMNEACIAGYSDLAWASVIASIATYAVLAYSMYNDMGDVMTGLRRRLALKKTRAHALRRKRVHQGSRTGESRRGREMPRPVGQSEHNR